MKKIIAIALILIIALVVISGCKTAGEKKEDIPQPPPLPEGKQNIQQQSELGGNIPQPPPLPEG